MSTPKLRGADALVQTLKNQGVTRIFTLSGNHIMPVFDACFASGIELIHTRHEGAAVHMADAWARLTGEVGIALVTGGPGHANAVGALYTAAMSDSPVVLLSGHAPNNQLGRGAFQEMRQADLAEPLTKGSWTASSVQALPRELSRAIQLAASGRPGPVHLSLPNDVLDAEFAEQTPLPGKADCAPVSQPLDPALARSLINRLQTAKQPLVLVGPQSMTRAGRATLDQLQTALGIPVVGMESPRGVGDPSLGAFAQVLAQADFILLLGKRLDFTLKFGQAPAISAAAQFVQIDAEQSEIDRSKLNVGHRLVEWALSDLTSTMEALLGVATRSPVHASWLAQVESAIAFRPSQWADVATSPQGMHPVQALRPLQALLDAHPDAVLVSDGGEIGQWAQACLHAPNRVINGVAGAIGSALPFAVAASLAFPNTPVVAVMGDGTFGFHCAELDTALRYQAPFVAVIGNDARWNAEYQIQLREYGASRTIGCELLPTRYDQVCSAFGGYGELVTDPAEVLAAAQRAQTSRLPACLNILIDGLAAPNIRR